MSKTVFSGFIAAWFLAASPIKRSSAVKETKEGVVKLPCSFATVVVRSQTFIGYEEETARSNILISTLLPS